MKLHSDAVGNPEFKANRLIAYNTFVELMDKIAQESSGALTFQPNTGIIKIAISDDAYVHLKEMIENGNL